MGKILIVEDDKVFREFLRISLSKINNNIFIASDGKSALELLDKERPDVVLLDLHLPDMDGIEVLKVAKLLDSEIQVIIITGLVDMKSIIRAMQYNAFDYLEKPFDSEMLNVTVDKLLKKREFNKKETIEIENESLLNKDNTDNIIIGNSPQIYEIYKMIGKVTSNRVSILMQGESGTGKELVSKVIHNSGITKGKPFVAVNCSALTETLLESELFGHVKGSFTGALRDKKGKFELAGEGTILLDEISEISNNMQVKLLRVIQEREFEKVGGEDSLKMKARIIAATNQDLYQLVKEGKFREDLYYRLKVFPITLPALRDRKSDIAALVVHFLKKINKELGKNVNKIPYEVMETLQNYDWPGNVRELENILTQAVILAKGDVLEKELILIQKLATGKESFPLISENKNLAEIEKEYIKLVLDEVNWDKIKASKILGIAKTTLYNKIESYSISKNNYG